MSVAALGIGVGAAAGLGGAALAARGASRDAAAQIGAGKDAQKLYDDRTTEGQLNLYRLLYGAGGRERFRGAVGGDRYEAMFGRQAANPEQRTALSNELMQIEQQLGQGPRAQTGNNQPGSSGRTGTGVNVPAVRRDLLARRDAIRAQLEGTDDARKGTFDPATWDAQAGDGMLSQMEALFGTFDKENKANEGTFSKETNDLLGMGDANLQSARGYGAARSAEAQRDADRMLGQLNATTRARAMASGVGGGTGVLNQLAGNTQTVYEALQRQRNEIGDQNLALTSGIRQNNMGTAGNRLGSLAALRQGNTLQSQSLRQQPLQTELSLLTSPAMNPYLGQNTTQYFPGVSGQASAYGSFGNSLSALGGLGMGYGAQALAGQQGGQQNGSTSLEQMRLTAAQQGGMPYIPAPR